jgi:hypothetical protein
MLGEILQHRKGIKLLIARAEWKKTQEEGEDEKEDRGAWCMHGATLTVWTN